MEVISSGVTFPAELWGRAPGPTVTPGASSCPPAQGHPSLHPCSWRGHGGSEFFPFPMAVPGWFPGSLCILPTGVSLEQLWGALSRAISIAPRGVAPDAAPPAHIWRQTPSVCRVAQRRPATSAALATFS